jgi:hypothetical protein
VKCADFSMFLGCGHTNTHTCVPHFSLSEAVGTRRRLHPTETVFCAHPLCIMYRWKPAKGRCDYTSSLVTGAAVNREFGLLLSSKLAVVSKLREHGR